MNRKTLSKYSAVLILSIFLLNLLAKKFYWYSAIWFFDMLMHFLGGFWLGLVFFWLLLALDSPLESFWRNTLKIILGVLIIGIAWEVFELVFDNYVAQNRFNLPDTLSDLCFDLAGGFSAVFFFYKKTTNIAKTTV